MPRPSSTALRETLIAAAVGLFCALGLALVLLPLWRSGSLVLGFNDGNIEGVLSPIFSYPGSLTRIWDDHFYFGRGDIGIGVCGWSLLETLLGPFAYRRWAPLLAVALVAAAGFWASRQTGRSRPAAAVSGVFLGLCGWTATAPLSGLLGRPLALLWAALALGLIERSESREGRGPLLGHALAGGAIGLSIAETADVGAFFALAVAAWWALAARPPGETLRRWRRHLPRLALLISVSALVASHTLVKMSSTELAASLSMEQSAEASWDWATQWSLPAVETLSLAVPGFHGASSRSDSSPYWGRLGQTPGWSPGQPGWRHFKLNGYFLGTAAAALLLFLLLELRRGALPEGERRRALFALLFAALALTLAWGRYFAVYRLFHALPYMDSIRNPEKWLGPMSLFAALAVGFAVDALIRRVKVDAKGWGRSVDAFALASAVLLLLLLGALRPDPDTLGSAQLTTVVSTGTRAVLAAVLALAGLALGRRLVLRVPESGRPWAIAAVLSALIAGQLLWAARPYVEIVDASYLSRPAALLEELEDLEPAGRLKLLPARWPLLNNWRLTYLASRGAPLFDPVSVRALPQGEAALFRALGNRSVDLWRLGAVRWFLATERAAAELRAASPDFRLRRTLPARDWDPRLADPEQPAAAGFAASRAERISLFELESARPMLEIHRRWTPVGTAPEDDLEVLRALAAEGADPAAARFVHLTAESPREPAPDGAGPAPSVRLLSSSPTRVEATVVGPGMLFRASRFDERWRASLDGQKTPLLRANALFQAVAVPAGEHRLELHFRPSQGLFYFSIAIRIALLAMALLYFGAPAARRRVAG